MLFRNLKWVLLLLCIACLNSIHASHDSIKPLNHYISSAYKTKLKKAPECYQYKTETKEFVYAIKNKLFITSESSTKSYNLVFNIKISSDSAYNLFHDDKFLVLIFPNSIVLLENKKDKNFIQINQKEINPSLEIAKITIINNELIFVSAGVLPETYINQNAIFIQKFSLPQLVEFDSVKLKSTFFENYLFYNNKNTLFIDSSFLIWPENNKNTLNYFNLNTSELTKYSFDFPDVYKKELSFYSEEAINKIEKSRTRSMLIASIQSVMENSIETSFVYNNIFIHKDTVFLFLTKTQTGDFYSIKLVIDKVAQNANLVECKTIYSESKQYHLLNSKLPISRFFIWLFVSKHASIPLEYSHNSITALIKYPSSRINLNLSFNKMYSSKKSNLWILKSQSF